MSPIKFSAEELAGSKIYRVYLITCLATGLQYAGQTCNSLARRFGKHLRDAERNKSRAPLSKAIREHGRENFVVSLLRDGLTKAEANQEETLAIDTLHLRCRDFGYNAAKGGSGFGRRKKRTVKLTELAELYQQGLSTTEIGKRTGLDNSTVGYWLPRLGVKTRIAAPPKKEVDDSKIVEMYRGGASCSKIAKCVGVCAQTVADRLRSLGEVLRSAKKPNKIPILEMVQRYQDGQTLADIAEAAGLSEMTVRTRLLEVGFTTDTNRRRGRKDVRTEEVVRLYANGLNSRQIAEKLNCGEVTIHTRLANAGVMMRPRGTRHPKTQGVA